MIQGFQLEAQHIQFFEAFDSWEEGIRLSAAPLLKEGYIKESYVEGMIRSVKEHGPYIVIAPNIAIPHARPEMGSVKVGFCFTKVEKPISFTNDEENKATLLITLSCVNADQHMEMLQGIVTVLSDMDKQQQLFDARTVEEVLQVFRAS